MIYAVLKNHEFGQPVWPVLESDIQTYASAWEDMISVTVNVIFYKDVWVQLMGY
jgi:hypothetical protein